jgi:hypothetical protein
MVNPTTGRPYGWVHHPEVMRFKDRPELLVARWFWLRDEGHGRGFKLTKEMKVTLPDGSVVEQDDFWLYPIPEEYANDWYEFRLQAAWPVLDSQWWTPWEREGCTYEHYRLEGKYADGVLGTPNVLYASDVQYVTEDEEEDD